VEIRRGDFRVQREHSLGTIAALVRGRFEKCVTAASNSSVTAST